MISQSELGRRLGLSKQSISKLKHQGMPVESAEAAQAWREARQNVAARKPTPAPLAVAASRRPDPAEAWPPMPDFPDEHRDAARTRREIAEANMAEMDEARLRRELIRVQAVQDQLALDYATTREGLIQIAARMGPILAAESDPAAVQRLLYAEIHQVLQRLAGASEAVMQVDGAFD
ncbi:hypothetical protein [Hydrogenophaga sp. OTU3427]|uniref:hypothetical protein n=1 Tax=Hydrogenophaga sp. OTU3427 TaxID=3043856 RepID=UPI00313EF8B0